MGIFDSVKNSATKAKLKADIALADREISAKQSAFGVELFDKLQQQQTGKNFLAAAASTATTQTIVPNVFAGANEKAFKEPFEQCKADVLVKQNEIDAKLLEIEKLQCDRERSRIESSMERLKTNAASHSHEAKLQMQIKLLKREIHQRKEQFGRDVFDALLDSNDSEREKKGGGMLSKLKPQDKQQKEISSIIERAARPIAVARQKKAAAQRDIQELESGA